MYHLAEIAEVFNYIHRLHRGQITANRLNFNYNFLHRVWAVHNNIKNNILFRLVSERLSEQMLKTALVSSASKK